MPELPYFPFYVADWASDPAVRMMNHEEKGVFIDLLAFAWDEGHIPADPAEQAHLLGISKQKLSSVWAKLERCWEQNGSGGLTNPKQEETRARQKQKQKAGSAGGKR